MRIDLRIKSKTSGKEVPVVLYPFDVEQGHIFVDLDMTYNDFRVDENSDESGLIEHLRNLVGHDVVIEQKKGSLYEELIEGRITKFDFAP